MKLQQLVGTSATDLIPLYKILIIAASFQIPGSDQERLCILQTHRYAVAQLARSDGRLMTSSWSATATCATREASITAMKYDDKATDHTNLAATAAASDNRRAPQRFSDGLDSRMRLHVDAPEYWLLWQR
jgi:hypothetical protein